MSEPTKSTHDKAFQINLDKRFYGTFAEIGAGQEVARWFFQVGGAAGTIAKSISAYDMKFSDAIYGAGERYVSEPRLMNMIDYEYDLLIERLSEKRGAENAFFAFANTVSARNYLGTNECHGWLGIKFQVQPQSDPNYVIAHVHMRDKENILQQEALGIFGVNLTWAALYLHANPEDLIESLMDGLNMDRIEVDMVRFQGPLFSNVDNRLMALQLVEKNLTNAALIGPDGSIQQPSDVFHKKSVLMERGSFRPVTHVNIDMMTGARKALIKNATAKDPDFDESKIVEVMEITMRNLLSTGVIDHKDFLARADLITAMGKHVLISNYARFYRLSHFFWRYTKAPIGIVLGVPNVEEILNEKYYHILEGGILEAFGRLFKNDLRLYIYPYKDPQLGEITTVHDLQPPEKLTLLFRYLTENDYIHPIEDYDENIMHIFSRNVLTKIRERDEEWETMVPPEVAKIIKERWYFGYRP
ncbi:MAG: TonB-dependent receptor [Verrucomicrobiota bacterium]